MRSLWPALAAALLVALLFLPTLLRMNMVAIQLQQELQTSREKVAELTDQLGKVRSSFDSLKSKIEEFSDGTTNWRDIVPEVEEEAETLDSELADAEAAAEELR